MRTQKNVTIYRCGYCNKLYVRSGACERHELKCSKNPENKTACSFCEHLEKREMVYYSEGYNGTYEDFINAFFCKAKKVWVYPKHKIHNPILTEDIDNTRSGVIQKGEYDPDIPNEPMPKEDTCKFYKFSEFKNSKSNQI